MIDPVENLPGLNRMMQIMALVGQGTGSGAGASVGIPLGTPLGTPLGASVAAPVESSARAGSSSKFSQVYSLVQSISTPGVTATPAAPISSALDWSGRGAQLPAGTPYAAEFEAAGRRYGISPKLLAAQADVESGFRIDAVSPVGAQGIMQFMPDTARGMGVDPLNPASAIDGAARYLRDLMGRFGTIEVALAAYNVGSGTVARAGGGVPAGARNYVEQILNRANGRTS